MHKLFLTIVIAGSCALAQPPAQTKVISPSTHVGFDSPEGWGLKYFTSVTMMSGLTPPEPLDEQRKIGSFTLGLELGWLPALNPERALIGFGGHKQEDINKAPIFFRPSLRVKLPWRLSVIA